MRPIQPKDEIRFAAKTGFLTKAIWNEFFASGGECWRRRNWNLLSSRGFFRVHTSKLASDVLVLNPKNELVRKTIGNEISRPPYLAQLDHDEITARSILRLLNAGAIARYHVEAELKRASPATQRRLPEEREKLPDALIELKSGVKVALEVELTLKSRRRYRQILRTYRLYDRCDRIIFIINSESIFNAVTEAMTDTYYPSEVRPIGFVWLDDWNEDPANAQIAFKTFTTTMQQMAA